MNNEYIFVRHGQTFWNKNGIMHGQFDIPLNYTGIKQAKKVATELKHEHFDLCLCSPLKRAKSTAFSILQHHKNTKIFYDDRLMELNKGLLEGKHLNSEKLLKNEDYKFLKKFNIESKKQFYARVKEFIEETEKNHKNKKILIVSHSGTIKMLFFSFNFPKTQLHKAYYDLHIKNRRHRVDLRGHRRQRRQISHDSVKHRIIGDRRRGVRVRGFRPRAVGHAIHLCRDFRRNLINNVHV